MIKHFTTSLAAISMAAFAVAQAPTVDVSIALRETDAGGGTFSAIGDNGGSAGGIEWVNRDGQQLTLDGTWQQFSFDLAADPILGFAGATADSILQGAFGTLEHIRVLNSGGYTGTVTVWVDDISNTITPSGGSPTTTNFGDFEGYASGTEVMFQEPDFSGSTSGNLMTGSSSGVDNMVASRTPSYKFSFTFVDGTVTRWARLTTFNAANQPNPLVRFDQASTISFWMRGGICQTDLGFQGPGTAISELCGDGLAAGQQSTYYISGAPANSPGALLFSIPGQANVPFLGGTLVSFAGLIVSAGASTDANGQLTLNVAGGGNPLDLVLQSAFIDTSLPELVAFTNALQVGFGQ